MVLWWLGTVWAAPSPQGGEDCRNGEDDDLDGKVDCEDSDCATAFFAPAERVGDLPSGSYAVSDIDLDGDGDVLVTTLPVGAYVNQGNGFEWTSLASVSDAVALAAADVDGDGDQDVVVGTSSYGLAVERLRLLRNRGDGTFEVTDVGPDAVGVTGFQLDDLDGDGDPDLILRRDSSWTRVAANDGTGRFGALVTAASIGPIQLTAADLDGDADRDLVLAWPDLRVVENLGSLSFGPPQLVTIAARSEFVAAGDLDRDGDPDLVALAGSGVTTVESLGDLRFGQKRQVASVDGFGVRVADLDRDGDDDILVDKQVPRSPEDSAAVWVPSLGAGVAPTGSTLTVAHCEPAWDFAMGDDLQLADIDRLAPADLLCPVGQDLVWYRGLECAGRDADGDTLTNGEEAALGTAVFASDTDQDGRDDAQELADGTDPLDPSSVAAAPDTAAPAAMPAGTAGSSGCATPVRVPTMGVGWAMVLIAGRRRRRT